MPKKRQKKKERKKASLSFIDGLVGLAVRGHCIFLSFEFRSLKFGSAGG